MMLKIGLIGSDNSHVERFSEVLNLKEHPAYWKDSGAKIWAIWGNDPARTEEGAKNGEIPLIGSSAEEVIDKCDLIFVMSRSADVHLEHARLVINAGKPLFVDKPPTQTPMQAKKLLALVDESKIPMTSFSTLRFGSSSIDYERQLSQIGTVRYATYLGPGSRINPYGGIIYYGIHIVELMLHFHGCDVSSITAVENPVGHEQSNISVTCQYSNGTLVNLVLIGDGMYLFHILAVGSDGIAEVPVNVYNYTKDAKAKAQAEGHNVNLHISNSPVNTDHYEKGVRKVLEILTGQTDGVPHEEILRAVQVCAAIEKSLVDGKPVDPRLL